MSYRYGHYGRYGYGRGGNCNDGRCYDNDCCDYDDCRDYTWRRRSSTTAKTALG